jgi:glycosyltransferase involved in cell wall biosynthesis
MKSIQPPPGAPHLCYCHSPARYLWEQTDDYAIGAGASLRAIGLAAAGRPLRRWDRRTADRVTKFLANSRHTAERIRRCYGRESTVVYPPVRTDFFTPDPAASRGDWLLVVAALEPYKRTDIVIEAANRAGFALKVVGGGSQEHALRAIAGPSVEMLGRVDDAELRDLYRRAKALVFPQIEDFGIIPVEAQACGCPVIAFGRGGALETITDSTGMLFDEQSADAVIDAVERFDGSSFDAGACRAQAGRFSGDVFDRAILAEVRALLAPTPDRS